MYSAASAASAPAIITAAIAPSLRCMQRDGAGRGVAAARRLFRLVLSAPCLLPAVHSTLLRPLLPSLLPIPPPGTSLTPHPSTCLVGLASGPPALRPAGPRMRPARVALGFYWYLARPRRAPCSVPSCRPALAPADRRVGIPQRRRARHAAYPAGLTPGPAMARAAGRLVGQTLRAPPPQLVETPPTFLFKKSTRATVPALPALPV